MTGSIIFRRVVARNIHLALFGISYIGATLIYGHIRLRKIVFLISLPIVLSAIFFCQQRSLWFATIVCIVILLSLYTFRRRQWIGKHKKQFIFITIILIITLISSLSITKVRSDVILLTISRLYVFLNPNFISSDTSWQIRSHEINIALEDLKGRTIWGSGLGATFVSPERLLRLSAPDNAYIYLLWKMGIVGLLLFFVIQFLFLRKCLLVLSKRSEADYKIFAATGLLNTIGLLIVGFANACITQYEYLIIWTAIIAAIEVISRKKQPISINNKIVNAF